MLPEDAQAHGFDNIGEALAASTELIEAYLRAADVAIEMVLEQEQSPRIDWHSTFNDAFENRANAKLVFRFLDEGVVHYLSDLKSTHVRNFAAPADGTYRIRFRARAYRSEQPIKVEVGAGDVHSGNRGRHIVGYFDVQPETTEIVFEDWFRAGTGFRSGRSASATCESAKTATTPGPGCCLPITTSTGPSMTIRRPASASCWAVSIWRRARSPTRGDIMNRFMPRAFRRPATAEEVDRYSGLVERLIGEGETFETALRAGLRAVLCAPEFLYLNEPLAKGGQQIDDYAIASRLSYFLWSTMPDAELLDLAAPGS